MKKITTGDKVRLKSGGPTMLVIKIEPEPGGQGQLVECNWFDKLDINHQAIYPLETLETLEKTPLKTLIF